MNLRLYPLFLICSFLFATPTFAVNLACVGVTAGNYLVTEPVSAQEIIDGLHTQSEHSLNGMTLEPLVADGKEYIRLKISSPSEENAFLGVYTIGKLFSSDPGLKAYLASYGFQSISETELIFPTPDTLVALHKEKVKNDILPRSFFTPVLVNGRISAKNYAELISLKSFPYSADPSSALTLHDMLVHGLVPLLMDEKMAQNYFELSKWFRSIQTHPRFIKNKSFGLSDWNLPTIITVFVDSTTSFSSYVSLTNFLYDYSGEAHTAPDAKEARVRFQMGKAIELYTLIKSSDSSGAFHMISKSQKRQLSELALELLANYPNLSDYLEQTYSSQNFPEADQRSFMQRRQSFQDLL